MNKARFWVHHSFPLLLERKSKWNDRAPSISTALPYHHRDRRYLHVCEIDLWRSLTTQIFASGNQHPNLFVLANATTQSSWFFFFRSFSPSFPITIVECVHVYCYFATLIVRFIRVGSLRLMASARGTDKIDEVWDKMIDGLDQLFHGSRLRYSTWMRLYT